MSEVRKKKLDPSVTDLDKFSEQIFGLEIYPWQRRVMGQIVGRGGKSRVAVKAANAGVTRKTGARSAVR
tara:strand:- start:300 stop:506 length:207 start_codon:yes stop_codon:yes gene_type:complete